MVILRDDASTKNDDSYEDGNPGAPSILGVTLGVILGFYWGYIGGYIGGSILKHGRVGADTIGGGAGALRARIIYRGFMGFYRDHIGIVEKKMATIIQQLGFRDGKDIRNYHDGFSNGKNMENEMDAGILILLRLYDGCRRSSLVFSRS